MKQIKQIKRLEPSSSSNNYIEGLVYHSLNVIPTKGGPLMHMLRSDSPYFKGFGEIYFSAVEAGSVKAWKKHSKQTQSFTVPQGQMRLILYDDREGSSSKGYLAEAILGRPDNYCLLQVPPLIWYGFSAIGKKMAIMANCADMPHDPEESESSPADSKLIPYRW